MPDGWTPVDDPAQGWTPVAQAQGTPDYQRPDTAGVPDAPTGSWRDYARTFGREAQSLGENVVGAPGGIYHAFADPATQEEKQESKGLENFPGALGVSRLVAKPIATAADWYKGAATGQVPDPVGQALTVAPEAVGTGAATEVGGKIMGEAADLPKTATEFFRRAKSLNDVTKAGAGVWSELVQKPIVTLQQLIKNEAAKTIQQAIEADKAAQTQPGQGTVSTGPAIAAVTKAMEETGHYSKPVQNLVDKLNTQPMLSLEDAQHLRSDIGNMASRAGDAKAAKIGWAAYDEITNGMGDRVEELQGTRTPFEHSNNEFRAAYNLNEGVTGKMMEQLTDRHDAIPRLKDVAGADLTEIKAQMQKYGMNPDAIDKMQANAKSVTAAHDSLSGKFNKSLYRMVMQGGAGAAMGVAVYSAARGAGLYGLAPMLLAMHLGAKAQGIPAQMDTGMILRKLSVNPDAFKVRPEVEGPMTFDYKNQDQVYSSPKAAPSGPDPQTKSDVLAALKSQGYKPADAANAMKGATGNDFDSLFKSALNRPRGNQ